MSGANQEYADHYIHHSTEPLGLREAQAADGGAMPNEPASVPTEPSNTNMSDLTRYNPDATEMYKGDMNSPYDAPAMPSEAESAFNDILFPPDSYYHGTYWADLPMGERMKFVNRQTGQILKDELIAVGRMFKRDPFSPISAYFSTYVVNGMGMFVEGYTLFSVGNLKPMFANTDVPTTDNSFSGESQFFRCWNSSDDMKKALNIPKDQPGPKQICDKQWLNAIDYLEIVGIIVGQILVGIEGDWVGRKFGMVQDALVMTLGSVMLTCMWGTSFNGWVICYAWSLFIYGIGVGGEYPMTSTRAMEGNSNRYASTTGDRLHRGRNVLLAFLMQGWGQFVNQVLLILLLLIFHNSLRAPISPVAAQYTFRVSFGVIAAFTLYLAYYRYYKIQYAEGALKEAKERLNTSGYDARSLGLALTHYWHRLIASTVGWFANDFFFYGNKIFSGQFIKIISPGGTFTTTWLYNLINVGVQLPGYYLAALLVDNKFYGRKWMQAISFMATFALFCGATFAFNELTNENDKPRVKAFQFIYFFSSFWNQFGYNSTTFLVAAEIFPASIRATCHGVGAASGKLGALIPTIIYHYVGPHAKFYIVTWFGLAGLFVTLLFLPDTTGLDLREQERYWEYVMNGNAQDYHGVAIHPRHLSLFERVVLKRHLPYNPQLDAQQKMAEFRTVFHSTVGAGHYGEEDLTLQQREFLSSELGSKFSKDPKFVQNGGHFNDLHDSKLESLEKQL